MSSILNRLASAVDHLHAGQIVHRDLKPANVMIAADGTVKLMDFGVARALNRTQLTQTGYALGTLEYASPEQIRGERVGPPADIYALGVIAYEMLSGRPPFSGDAAHIVYAAVHLAPPPLEDVVGGLPREACLAVEAAIAKESVGRPASAGAFTALFNSSPLPATQAMAWSVSPATDLAAPATQPPQLPRTKVERTMPRFVFTPHQPVVELARYRFEIDFIPSYASRIAGSLAIFDSRLTFEPFDSRLNGHAPIIFLCAVESLGRTHGGNGPKSALVVHVTGGRQYKFSNIRDSGGANAVITAIQSVM